ncbi:MAG: molecular chaperone DnaJ [Chloroflexi bacterium]|nr:molecular chaperone DnaJ [Chloroflexota bacterium]
MNKDYYQILGIERNATSEDVKKAFRRLAFECHPDRNKLDGAEERFKAINEAYQVLSDPAKRTTYDQFGNVEGSPFGKGFDGFGFGGMGDIFDAFFGTAASGKKTPQKGSDLNARLDISFEQAIFGCEQELEVTRVETCAECRGRGAEKGTKPESCINCGGTGRVQRVERSVFGRFVNVVSCEKCHGEGKVITRLCPVCSGAGRMKKLKRMTVVVPAGVDGGYQLRLSGEGNAGTLGGPGGDLFVQLSVQAHDHFQREGTDIIYILPLNFAQAALGDRVEVPTLDGKANLDITPGTQHGDSFRIGGKGSPRPGGGRRGDQIVKVKIVTPTGLDEDQRRLFEDLKASLERVPVGARPAAKEGKGLFGKLKDAF